MSETDSVCRFESLACWLLFAACALVGLRQFDQASSIAIDDAYIYFTSARNLLLGFGSVLNPGDGHSASTGPGWAVLLAAISASTEGEAGLARGAIVAAAVFLLVGSISLTVLLRPRLGVAAGLSPLAVFSTPCVTYCNGIETSAAIGMLLAMLASMFRAARLEVAFFVLGIAYTVRPDLAVMGLPMSIVLVDRLRRRSPTAPWWPSLIRCGVAGAIAPLLWHGYAFATMGAVLPQGLNAKSLQGASGIAPLFIENLPLYLEIAVTDHRVLQLGALVGLIFLRREAWPLLLFAGVRVLAYWLMSVADYAWYSYDIALLGRIGLVFGLYELGRIVVEVGVRWIRRAARATSDSGLGARRAAAGLGIGLVVAVFWPGQGGPVAAGLPKVWSTRFVSDQLAVYRSTAEWLRRERSAELAGSVLLAHEVGILSYLLPEVEIRDVVGIGDPDVTRATIGDWNVFVDRHRPLWLVPMFDTWHEEIAFLGSDDSIVAYRRVFISAGIDRSRQAPIYERQEAPTAQVLSVGDVLGFGPMGSGLPYIAGAYAHGQDASWLTGHVNGLFLPMDATSDRVRVRLAVYPFRHGDEVRRQRVQIWQGGALLLEHVFEGGPEELVFEPRVLSGSARLRLMLPDAAVPAALGVEGGNRERLSLMLLSLSLEQPGES